MKSRLLVVGLLIVSAFVLAGGAPTLKISGVIALKNSKDSYVMTLDEMKTKLEGTTYLVKDPWLGNQFYQGVKLIELLEYVGYPKNAEKIVLVCSDGKEFVVKVKDAKLYPIMIAYASKGRDIPGSQGGPFKLVFPRTMYPEIDELYPKENWAWWIVEIRVEMGD